MNPMRRSLNNGASVGSEIASAIRLRWREEADIMSNLIEQGVYGASPDLDGLVGTCGCKHLPVRAPSDAIHTSLVAYQSSKVFTTFTTSYFLAQN